MVRRDNNTKQAMRRKGMKGGRAGMGDVVLTITPFEVEVLPVNASHGESMEIAGTVYEALKEKGVDTILDDRDERPGVKFKDCDLIGVPLRVTIGERALKEGNVEIKMRTRKEPDLVRKEEIVGRVMKYVESARGR